MRNVGRLPREDVIPREAEGRVEESAEWSVMDSLRFP